MPSGAKKRKAARKKKESQAHLNGSQDSPQGTVHEVKSQDEKDSDVDDVNSPPHQGKEEHENQFCKGTELVHERDHSAIPQIPADNNDSSWGEEISGSSKDGFMKNAESVDVSNDRNGEHSTVILIDRSGVSEKNLQEEPSIRTSDSSFDEVAAINKPLEKAISMVTGSTHTTDKPVVHSPIGDPIIDMENETPASETDVNVEASSSGVEHKAERYDSAELPASHLPVAVANCSDEYVKESSEYQPLVALAPRMMERTSWLSCCGLFELIPGSNK